MAEELRHAERGEHRVKSREQAIAIGLSKARRAGVKVPARKRASSSREKTGRRARAS